MKGPKMARVRGDGVELQTMEWSGRGGPVVCVHGLTANGMCFAPLAGTLAPEYRVLALDLRGRGRSDQPKSGYCVDQHVEDLRAVMERLDLPPAALIGHSLGASIVLAFAAKYPGRVDRLVLLDGAGKLTKTQAGRVLAGIKPAVDRLGRVYPSFAEYVAALKSLPFLSPWTEAHTAYFQYEVEEVSGGVRSRVKLTAIQQELVNLMRFDPGTVYKSVRCPTLILRAPEGMLAPDDVLLPKSAVKAMVGGLARVWLVEAPGANHYSILFNANPTRDRALLAFLGAPSHGRQR